MKTLALATWMNDLAHKVGSGVYHWVTEGKIHFLRINTEGNIVERGIL